MLVSVKGQLKDEARASTVCLRLNFNVSGSEGGNAQVRHVSLLFKLSLPLR